MAGAKVLKKRILVVKNTRKITRTMEMVSTAKSKRMVSRVNAARPYNEKILEILESMEKIAEEGETNLPLLRKVENPHRIGLLVITANRGLCGGYNANILRMARAHIVQHQSQGRQVEVTVIGKKGNAFFKFLKLPVRRVITDIDDTFKYEQAKHLADDIIGAFSTAQYDRVEVISTVYYNAALQKPLLEAILPVGANRDSQEHKEETSPRKKAKNHSAFLFEPDPSFILKRILPHVIRATIFRKILEAVTSEQIYRRIAMKNATDNAGEMGKLLTRTYNRKRQAGITQELAEIVSGADAIG